MANSGVTAHPHCLRLSRPSLLYRYYAFIDTPEYFTDQLFIRHEVTVKFLHEFVREGTPYVVIHCRTRKIDEEHFLAALTELPDKMLLCGHADYLDFCTQTIGRIKHDAERGRSHE